MGFEKGITRKWRDMVLDGNYPPNIPGGPRSPDSPAGGTPNHELLARLARLTWALEKGTAAQQTEELDGVVQFYDNQIEGGFMTRGNANEQCSPSHSQWWLTAALGLRWLGWERRDSRPDVSKKLLDVTGRWLGHHHALCRLFATNDGIVAPGARAWPHDKLEPGQPYYGKCKQRDVLYDSIESGRVKKLWTSDNLDMLGLIFADRLLKAGDDLGGAKTATELPKLRWPISYRRLEGNFTAWLTTIDGNAGLSVQRLATWRGGQDSYGFDDAVEEVWEGTEARILGEKAGGGSIDKSTGSSTGGNGSGELSGLPALIAGLRDVADRRKNARGELLELVNRLETPGADLEEIGAALRDLAERRPAARAEVLDLADRLERFRVGPVEA
ncbi:MAG: hypothetical protein ACJ759_02380 [Thermoanaerobaculia bacterium]